MPILQVRDVPEDLYRLLTEAARRERRSLAQQALALLAQGLQVEPDPQARRRRVLDQIRKRTGAPVELTREPADLIREDGER